MNNNSSRKTTRKRRKKLTPIDPSSKGIYREHKLMEHLLARYTDRERVLNLMQIDSVADLPDEFYAQAEGIPVCRVSVDWRGIKRAISKVTREIAQRASAKTELTPERIEQTIDRAASSATFYVFQHMPDVLDLALSRLCLEAQMAKSAHLGREWIKSGVNTLAKLDREATARRLEVHEGPRPAFRHRSQYEHALATAIREVLGNGEKVTQGTVAGKLGKEKEDSIDDRVVRSWNTEFGINWKGFVKEVIKADKS